MDYRFNGSQGDDDVRKHHPPPPVPPKHSGDRSFRAEDEPLDEMHRPYHMRAEQEGRYTNGSGYSPRTNGANDSSFQSEPLSPGAARYASPNRSISSMPPVPPPMDDVYADETLYFERSRIKQLQDERVHIQKKTFTKWCNSFLNRARLEVVDLFSDLSDGVLLMKLLEIISGDKLGKPNRGKMRVQMIENLNKSIDFLKRKKIQLENIGAEDILDRNERLILGLIWTIILRFQIDTIVIDVGEEETGERKNAKDALLLWCQRKTAGYSGVKIDNFTTSWRSGLAFNALIHAHRPDLIHYDGLTHADHIGNLNNAFDIAEKKLEIARLLDAEDVDTQRPDEKSIITYVSLYYHYFAKQKTELTGAMREANIVGKIMSADASEEDYEAISSDLLAWIRESIKALSSRNFPNSLRGIQEQMFLFNQFRNTDKPPKYKEKGELEAIFFIIQTKRKAMSRKAYVAPQGKFMHDIESAWVALERAESERQTALTEELLIQSLAERFLKKAQLCESWLRDMGRVVEQLELPRTAGEVDATLKKHQGISADVLSREELFKALSKMCLDLCRENYHESDKIRTREREIIERWTSLLALLEEKRLALEALNNLMTLLRDLDAPSTELQQLDPVVRARDVGKHMLGVEDLLQKHALFETQFTGHDNWLKKMTHEASVFFRSNGEQAEVLKRRLGDVTDQYESLRDLCDARRAALHRARDHIQFEQDDEEEAFWLAEEQQVCQRALDSSDISHVRQIQRLYKDANESEWPMREKGCANRLAAGADRKEEREVEDRGKKKKKEMTDKELLAFYDRGERLDRETELKPSMTARGLSYNETKKTKDDEMKKTVVDYRKALEVHLRDKQRVLEWAVSILPNQAPSDFISKWEDGSYFYNLVSALAPGEMQDWKERDQSLVLVNTQYTMGVAEEFLLIEKVVPAEELCRYRESKKNEALRLQYFIQFLNLPTRSSKKVAEKPETGRSTTEAEVVPSSTEEDVGTSTMRSTRKRGEKKTTEKEAVPVVVPESDDDVKVLRTVKPKRPAAAPSSVGSISESPTEGPTISEDREDEEEAMDGMEKSTAPLSPPKSRRRLAETVSEADEEEQCVQRPAWIGGRGRGEHALGQPREFIIGVPLSAGNLPIPHVYIENVTEKQYVMSSLTLRNSLKLANSSDAEFICTFNPTHEGFHSIEVSIDGYYIDGSPSIVAVYIPDPQLHIVKESKKVREGDMDVQTEDEIEILKVGVEEAPNGEGEWNLGRNLRTGQEGLYWANHCEVVPSDGSEDDKVIIDEEDGGEGIDSTLMYYENLDRFGDEMNFKEEDTLNDDVKQFDYEKEDDEGEKGDEETADAAIQNSHLPDALALVGGFSDLSREQRDRLATVLAQVCNSAYDGRYEIVYENATQIIHYNEKGVRVPPVGELPGGGEATAVGGSPAAAAAAISAAGASSSGWSEDAEEWKDTEEREETKSGGGSEDEEREMEPTPVMLLPAAAAAAWPAADRMQLGGFKPAKKDLEEDLDELMDISSSGRKGSEASSATSAAAASSGGGGGCDVDDSGAAKTTTVVKKSSAAAAATKPAAASKFAAASAASAASDGLGEEAEGSGADEAAAAAAPAANSSSTMTTPAAAAAAEKETRQAEMAARNEARKKELAAKRTARTGGAGGGAMKLPSTKQNPPPSAPEGDWGNDGLFE